MLPNAELLRAIARNARLHPRLPPPERKVPEPTSDELLRDLLEEAKRRAWAGCASMSWPHDNVYGFLDTYHHPRSRVIAEEVVQKLRSLGYGVGLHERDPELSQDDDGNDVPSGIIAYSVLVEWG